MGMTIREVSKLRVWDLGGLGGLGNLGGDWGGGLGNFGGLGCRVFLLLGPLHGAETLGDKTEAHDHEKPTVTTVMEKKGAAANRHNHNKKAQSARHSKQPPWLQKVLIACPYRNRKPRIYINQSDSSNARNKNGPRFLHP